MNTNIDKALLSLKETQDVELEIMKKLHDYCVYAGLRYCMAYGTLLGAVRHGGFIPWDNDIDICMPRADFQRLLEMVKTIPVGDNIHCVHYTVDDRYHYQVIRFFDDRTIVRPTYIKEQPRDMGVWVDVFPVDGVPRNIFDHPLYQLRLSVYKWIQLADIYAVPFSSITNKSIKGILSNIIKSTTHKILPNKNNIHEYKIDYYASKFSYNKYKKVADIIERQKPLWLEHEDFDNPTLMKFEKYQFFAPQNWDSYLTRCYGDYMKLPPENQRMTHDIGARWKE